MSQNNELREVLQALHDYIAEYQRINHLGGYDNHCMKRARAAIAAQAVGQSEPVAWLANYINKSGLHCVYTSSIKSLAIENDSNGTPQPLYTHPAPVRHPLSDDELDLICEQALFGCISYQQLARSIETTHGITAQ